MKKPLDSAALQEYAFALVDAEMIEQLPEGLIPEVLMPKILASSAHLMPALIDLTRLPVHRMDAVRDCIDAAYENDQAPPIVLLLKTRSAATETARHWNAMQIAEVQPKRKLWLRLHDPRVLHQLLRILDPMQRRKLFGVAQAFTYWIGHEWITALRDIGNPSSDSIAENEIAPYAGPARWDWPRIEQIGLVNRALHGAGIWQAGALVSQGALAEKLIGRAARRYGLVDQADLVEFAIRGLAAREAFDEHPDIARVVRPNSTSTDSNLSDRFALIGDHVWNELRET